MNTSIRTGQLYLYKRRPVVVCGNACGEDGRIWCHRWFDGKRVDPPADQLTVHPRAAALTAEDLHRQFHAWATQGNADAMWWLGWWFEGEHHPRSVWYYVAALRANPRRHGWAQARIMSDARSAYMCKGVPKPDLAFLDEIPEMQGEPIGADWIGALNLALAAKHLPAAATPGPSRHGHPGPAP